MAKAGREERMLDTLRGAADAGPAMLREVVQQALTDSSAAVVARAATLAREQSVGDLTDELQTALMRMMNVPAKTDPGAGAKVAIVTTLRHRDAGDAETYRKLAAWADGDADGASMLRAEAALALVGAGDAEAPRLLVDLLFRPVPEYGDDNASDRLAAARGFGEMDWPPAALVLRAKLRAGDREPGVLGECCGAIARLDPPWAAEFVADWLQSHPHGPRRRRRATGRDAAGVGLRPAGEPRESAARRGSPPGGGDGHRPDPRRAGRAAAAGFGRRPSFGRRGAGGAAAAALPRVARAPRVMR